MLASKKPRGIYKCNTFHDNAIPTMKGLRVLNQKLFVRMGLVLGILIATVCISQPAFSQNSTDMHWVGTWAASPALGNSRAPQVANQTLREIIHTTIGGTKVRIRVSNLFGTTSLLIGAAHIAVRDAGSGIVAATDHALTFSGQTSFAIPPGAVLLSDAVDMDVPGHADLAVSLFVPGAMTEMTGHWSAQQTSYISAAGNFVAAPTLTNPTEVGSWILLSAVEVFAPEADYAIAAFGDSITDGAWSTLNVNHRWPDFLEARLAAAGKHVAVLNEGIGGNRILHDGYGESTPFGPSALERFDRDVLSAPGVKYLIVLEGINDIGHGQASGGPGHEVVSATDIIAGLLQIIERAHEKGLTVIGCTLTPFAVAKSPGYYSPEKDAKRHAVNDWIRTSGKFDGVVDFDKATQDPQNPSQFLPAYDSGDHLHPRDDGYKAMGAAIDLSLFK
jgi:lysophospholipase L1-like esterase